ncbi:hypothetical protein GO755_40460 [Spirosoma sp. HMF4905]|uniref:Phage integrase SAM-like domain-containing protein n=1 Tax=Spirosoma arboris TaxID=2682092 RepID=A0A7K1SRZ5_9BACT|nr:phage integrase SAM-like domain-containing protein [Spirosoma arboris]MVM36346.1 hypothetical protein [Spirosoma arboris]
MNHYLKCADQPMYVRFEFRKNQRQKCSKYQGGTVPSEMPGKVYATLIIGTIYDEITGNTRGIPYGPYGTKITTTKGLWDLRRSLRPTPEVRELNRQISSVQNELEVAHAELCRQIREQQTGLIINGPMVLDIWKRLKSVNPVTLAEVYGEFIAWKKSMIQPNRRIRKPEQISPATFKTYPKWWVLIQQFLHHKKQLRMPVMNVEYAIATNLVEWMVKQHTSRGAKTKTYAQSSISKTIKLLKMLLIYAQSKGYVRYNVLATFSIPAGSPADPKPLTEGQMNQLETAELPPALRHQCDSWLVAAELCLHYADFMELPNMKFVTSETGKLFIQHDRAKQAGTKLIQTVNLTPRAQRLLDRYNGPTGLYYGSNSYWSKILKRIAREADLRDEQGDLISLQFGQGRDTGLTQRAIQGATSVQLSKMAGWSKTGQAERYVANPVAIVEAFANTLKAQPEPRPDKPFTQIHKAS